jgi:hypothetical protein
MILVVIGRNGIIEANRHAKMGHLRFENVAQEWVYVRDVDHPQDRLQGFSPPHGWPLKHPIGIEKDCFDSC